MRFPWVRAAVLAVSHATASPAATLAMLRCATTSPPNAHHYPRREILARVGAALPVPDATHAHTQRTGTGELSPAASSVVTPTVRAPTDGPRCPGLGSGSRTVGTSHQAPQPDTPAPHNRAQAAARDFQTEDVQAGERGQVRTGETRPRGGVRHVWGGPPSGGEVFQVAGVGTSIIGRPRPTPSGTPPPAHLHPRLG
jgi:hypothetical protein